MHPLPTLPVHALPRPTRSDPAARPHARTYAPAGLFFGLTQYTELAENAQEQVERYYKYFIDVQVMIFIGFGFLMTFMRRYSYGAVSLNYFASALMFLEAILMIGATQVRACRGAVQTCWWRVCHCAGMAKRHSPRHCFGRSRIWETMF